MSNYLISVVGPTGIGKTRLSIALAKHFNTEIISADSRQFYREMQIGTAAPSAEELAAAPHHFIHHKSIGETYNVGAYEKDAIASLEQLFKTHDKVLMVGGSGLYINAVTKGLDEFPKVDSEIRVRLNAKLKAEGLEALKLQLKILDPKIYDTIEIDNPQRVIRALEVCVSSGAPYSSFLTSKDKKRDFTVISVGLTADRTKIYERIEARVDLMMAAGLLDEAKGLEPQKHLNALQTVGYKELFKHIEGEWDLEFAVSEIKKNTRRFAKRQLTWFKRNEDTLWFDLETPTEHIIDAIALEIE